MNPYKRLVPLLLIAGFSSTLSLAQQKFAVTPDSTNEALGGGIATTKAGAPATVASVIDCASSGSERQHCAADTSAGVVMLHPTGDVACLLGRNWGYDASGVWVTEGCAGEFATGSTTRVAAASSGSGEVISVNGFTPADAKTVTTGVNPEIAKDNKYVGFFEPYGSLRTIVGISDGQAQVQDDASRVGRQIRYPRTR